MLDLKYIRDNLQAVRENTRRRNSTADPDKVVALDAERNRLLASSEALRARRNANAQAMKAKVGPEERQRLIEEGKSLKGEIAGQEQALAGVEAELAREAARVPNLTHPLAPEGTGEQANRELKRWGKPRCSFRPRTTWSWASPDLVIRHGRGVSAKFYYLKTGRLSSWPWCATPSICFKRKASHSPSPPTWPRRRWWRASASTRAARSPTSTPSRARAPA
jgi:seryl-tRNA synthetase